MCAVVLDVVNIAGESTRPIEGRQPRTDITNLVVVGEPGANRFQARSAAEGVESLS
jgi:hypothetical protein